MPGVPQEHEVCQETRKPIRLRSAMGSIADVLRRSRLRRSREEARSLERGRQRRYLELNSKNHYVAISPEGGYFLRVVGPDTSPSAERLRILGRPPEDGQHRYRCEWR